MTRTDPSSSDDTFLFSIFSQKPTPANALDHQGTSAVEGHEEQQRKDLSLISAAFASPSHPPTSIGQPSPAWSLFDPTVPATASSSSSSSTITTAAAPTFPPLFAAFGPPSSSGASDANRRVSWAFNTKPGDPSSDASNPEGDKERNDSVESKWAQQPNTETRSSVSANETALNWLTNRTVPFTSLLSSPSSTPDSPGLSSSNVHVDLGVEDDDVDAEVGAWEASMTAGDMQTHQWHVTEGDADPTLLPTRLSSFLQQSFGGPRLLDQSSIGLTSTAAVGSVLQPAASASASASSDQPASASNEGNATEGGSADASSTSGSSSSFTSYSSTSTANSSSSASVININFNLHISNFNLSLHAAPTSTASSSAAAYGVTTTPQPTPSAPTATTNTNTNAHINTNAALSTNTNTNESEPGEEPGSNETGSGIEGVPHHAAGSCATAY